MKRACLLVAIALTGCRSPAPVATRGEEKHAVDAGATEIPPIGSLTVG